MRLYSFASKLLLALTLAFCVGAFAQAQDEAIPDRLPNVISAAGPRIAIANTVDTRARAATVRAPATASRVLPSLSLRFKMTDAQSANLTELLAAQQNPASPLFRKWLTPEEFGSRFGLSQGDLSSIASWLTSQGFRVTEVARGRTFLNFTGTVDQVNRAFALELKDVTFEGEQHLANLTDPQLPTPVAAVVQSVLGLNDFHLKPRSKFRTVAAGGPRYTNGTSGSHFIAPNDLYTLYDINGLLSQSINGSGIKIAVLGQVAINTTDVSAFRAASGLSNTNLPTTITYGVAPAAPTQNGTNGTPTLSDLDESQLDVEWSGAAAPGASIVFVNGVDIFANAMAGAIDNKVAPIVTVSYGACETQFGPAEETLFQQANAQGQTILGPAGDSGATDCDYAVNTARQGLAVDYPASSPFVTGVGGTSLVEGGGTYWNNANTSSNASALSYIPEQPWNESFLTASACGGTTKLCGLSAGGGGASVLYPKPLWQVGTGVPNDAARDVPDLALSADADHDGYLFCSQGSCVKGFANAKLQLNVVGGTSVSTPIFAGIVALLEQKLSANLGNANPTLYGLANSSYGSSVFHDVTTGNNASPCQAGTAGCALGHPNYFAPNALAYPVYAGSTGSVPYPAIGYKAGAGYDLTSGWGSIDVANLVADWPLVAPVGTGAVAAASTTTLSASAASVTAGQTLTLTAAVAPAGGSSIPVPTGEVQLSVDGAAVGSAVTLTNGAAAFPPYATGALAPGSHTFTATYSGDGTYATSKGSTSVDITSVTTQDFSLTPATASVTTASGTTANGVTLTVSPLNGFTGPVAFQVTTDSPGVAVDYNLSVNPITISRTSPGTTVFTLSAFTSQGRQLRRSQLRAMASERASGDHPPLLPKLPLSGGALTGLALLGLPRGRRRFFLIAIALLGGVVLTMSGCGGTANNSSSGIIDAAPGTYRISVIATGTNSVGTTVSHTALITFVVQ